MLRRGAQVFRCIPELGFSTLTGTAVCTAEVGFFAANLSLM
jgi:hypothetical protein